MKFELLEQSLDSLDRIDKMQIPDNLTLFFLWKRIDYSNSYGKGFIKELQSMSMSKFFDKFKLIDKDKQSEFVESLLSGASNLDQNFLNDMAQWSSEQLKQFIYHTAINNAVSYYKSRGFENFTLYKPQAKPEKYIPIWEKIQYTPIETKLQEAMIKMIIEWIMNK